MDKLNEGIKYGLLNEHEVYVQCVSKAYSCSFKIKWEPDNGGWTPVLTASDYSLKFLATHSMLLHIFAVKNEPTMTDVLDSLAPFGVRLDLVMPGVLSVTETNPNNDSERSHNNEYS
ncbi:hypothetical protein J3175_004549 [Salmonella enterica]|nr:hypothetical protein [Salmonella enterica]